MSSLDEDSLLVVGPLVVMNFCGMYSFTPFPIQPILILVYHLSWDRTRKLAIIFFCACNSVPFSQLTICPFVWTYNNFLDICWDSRRPFWTHQRLLLLVLLRRSFSDRGVAILQKLCRGYGVLHPERARRLRVH